MSASSSAKAKKIVRILRDTYGEIPWWPGDTDEVMIGAILTQQTRWENVEKALSLLKAQGLFTLASLRSADPAEIEDAIRCTGFFRMKAQRLRNLADHVSATYGSVEAMAGAPTATLRDGLLSVCGIGAETADSILCYGFSRASFVIDAYTDRIVRCAGIPIRREELKPLFEAVLPDDPAVYRQTHAHFVEYAKEYCGKKRCNRCRIARLNG